MRTERLRGEACGAESETSPEIRVGVAESVAMFACNRGVALPTSHRLPPGVADGIEQDIGIGNEPGGSSVLADIKEGGEHQGEYVSTTITGSLTNDTMVLGWEPE
jgi:hypothetical protein